MGSVRIKVTKGGRLLPLSYRTSPSMTRAITKMVKLGEARGTVVNCSSVLIAQFHVSLLGILEDGKAVQTGVTTASGTAGMPNTEKRNNGGPQCVNPMVHGTGVRTQRQNSLRAAEVRV